MCAIELEPVIRTERLRLRRPRLKDAARIAELADDFEVARMTARLPHPYGVQDARGWLERTSGQDPAREAVFAVEHDQAGVVGMLGFHRNEQGFAELGYWLGRPYWGQGLATEAAAGALGWAADDWRRKVVFAGHFADNPASGGVLAKAGFLYTGEVRKLRSLARRAEVPSRTMVWLA